MIKVPALRERAEDIPLLINHFLRKFSATYGKPVMKVRALDPRAPDRASVAGKR